MAQLISTDQLEATRVAQTPEWEIKSESLITRCFRFDAYLDGIAFVNKIAELAESANHHPDITIGWCRVTLELSTHSAGGLTALDFDLASR